MKRKNVRYLIVASIAVLMLALLVIGGILLFRPIYTDSDELPAAAIYSDLNAIRYALIESGYEPDSQKILVSLDVAIVNSIEPESILSRISEKRLRSIEKRDWRYVVPEHLIGRSWESLSDEELVVIVTDTGYVKRAGIRKDYVIVYESK